MKNLNKRIFAGIAAFAFTYLLAAFYSVSFNIAEWTPDTRWITVVLGGSFTLIASTFPTYGE
jgi:steroid 5-alpha reductase family enzyme